MLTLTLMRHAKSSWKSDDLSDFDRPLNKRGRRDAPEIGTFMRKERITPDLILCSAAKRTRETYELLDNSAQFEAETRFLDDLYLIGEDQLLKLLKSIPSDYKHICVIAHNPGLHEAVINFTKTAPNDALEQLALNFPTSAVALFEFDIDTWQDLSRRSGKLLRLVTPASLGIR